MKKALLISLAAVAALCLYSCKKDSDPSLTVTPDTPAAIAVGGGSVEVTVTANDAWTVSVPAEATWLTVTPTSGNGDGKVTFTAPANLGEVWGLTAEATFKLKDIEKTVTLSQEAVAASRATDSLALVAIYNAADGANWNKNKWDLNTAINTWSAVTVANDRVTALKLSTADVVASEWVLPAQVGNLTELTDLRVNSNKLTGVIPESVYKLSKLTSLYFQNNKLSGSFSEKLGDLTELTNIYIDRNADFGGALPASIGKLTKLKNINIAKTAIGGTIPAELGTCAALTSFMAYETNLATPIPDVWDKFPSIAVIQLYGNPNMTGALPEVFTKINVTKNFSLWLYNCNFEGNIPESYGSASQYLNQFRIQGNKMSGEVPAAVRAHTKWSTWNAATYILPQQEGYGLTVPAE